MLMIVKNNFHVKKVACCFLWPVMVSAAFVQPKKPATFTAVPTCESVFSAKIYISVDSGKRISEKCRFEHACLHALPRCRCRRSCKCRTHGSRVPSVMNYLDNEHAYPWRMNQQAPFMRQIRWKCACFNILLWYNLLRLFFAFAPLFFR